RHGRRLAADLPRAARGPGGGRRRRRRAPERDRAPAGRGHAPEGARRRDPARAPGRGRGRGRARRAPSSMNAAPPSARGLAAPLAVAGALRLACLLATDRVAVDVLRYFKVGTHLLDVSWNPYLAPPLYPYP